jgi:predicted S18 family serine protease
MKMNRMLKLLAITALVALPALAQTQEVSTLTVDQPLQVGPKVLQPGIYQVRLLPTFAERTKVQFTSVDGQKIYASVLTVPHPLSPKKEESHATFVYYADAAGAPVALRTWYPAPASALGGHDIVYEEGKAKQLAALSKTNVVYYTDTTESADLNTTPLSVITPEQTVEVYTPPAPMTSSTTETTTTTTTESTPAPAPTTEAAPVQVADNTPMPMPRTASDLPLVALLGLGAIGGAIALRASRQA